jgi:phosphatidylglycerophosphate synthase
MKLSMMSAAYEIKPVFVSKITTALQIGTIFFALFFKIFTSDILNNNFVIILSWLTASFTIISGLIYISKGIKFLNRTS